MRFWYGMRYDIESISFKRPLLRHKMYLFAVKNPSQFAPFRPPYSSFDPVRLPQHSIPRFQKAIRDLKTNVQLAIAKCSLLAAVSWLFLRTERTREVRHLRGLNSFPLSERRVLQSLSILNECELLMSATSVVDCGRKLALFYSTVFTVSYSTFNITLMSIADTRRGLHMPGLSLLLPNAVSPLPLPLRQYPQDLHEIYTSREYVSSYALRQGDFRSAAPSQGVGAEWTQPGTYGTFNALLPYICHLAVINGPPPAIHLL